MKDIVSDGWDVTRRKKKFIASEFFRNFFVNRKLLWKSKKAKLKRPVSLKALYLNKEMFKAPFWNCGKKIKKVKYIWDVVEEDIYSSDLEHIKKKKAISLHEESNVRPSDSRLQTSITKSKRLPDTHSAYSYDKQCWKRNLCKQTRKIYIILYHFLGLKIYHLSYLKGCLMFSVNLGKSDVPPWPMASLRQIHSLSCLVYGGELWYVSLLNRRYFLFLCEQS